MSDLKPCDILFFSGGSALRGLSSELVKSPLNSTHIITVFDSGGSSREIRNKFSMPAVGDLRNRLISLSCSKEKWIISLMSYRLSKEESNNNLKKELENILKIPNEFIPLEKEDSSFRVIKKGLSYFLLKLSDGFNFKGASVGNLVLTAYYFLYSKNLYKAICTISTLLEVKHLVLPISEESVHLGVTLENNKVLLGQDVFSDKNKINHLDSSIKELFFTKSLERIEPIEVKVSLDVIREIKRARLICYPMGSFYSSILSNLLSDSVSESIKASKAIKVYIPNAYMDKEQLGLTLEDSINILLKSLTKNNLNIKPKEVLNFVLFDKKNLYMPLGQLKNIKNLEIEVIDRDLSKKSFLGSYDPKKLFSALKEFL